MSLDQILPIICLVLYSGMLIFVGIESLVKRNKRKVNCASHKISPTLKVVPEDEKKILPIKARLGELGVG